jgi:hypothetical protein
MNRLHRTSVASFATTLALLIGCGGNVNLGGKGSNADSNGNDDPPTTTDPDPSASTSVVALPEVVLESLAVAGDYLYFTGDKHTQTLGLYRCEKARCKATLKLLIKGNFGFPQVFDDRLGLTRFGEGNFDLVSFGLPDASDPEEVLKNLPALQPTPALFREDFVYFSVSMDNNIYRCARPTCAAGPERIAPILARNYVELLAEGDFLFWSDEFFINRVRSDGQGPVESLLPDELLSAAPATAFDPNGRPADSVESIAIGDGVLYASVARSQNGESSDSSSPHDIVGWPLAGGASQVFFKSDTLLRGITIVDGELIWLGPSTKAPSSGAATISSCRVEACEATYRELGEVKPENAVFAADEHDLYWIEAVAQMKGGLVEGFKVEEIRRAPRLPKPSP